MKSKCGYLDKEITIGILKPIRDRFLSLFEQMCEEEKIEPSYAQRGLALALAYSTTYFEETMNPGSDMIEFYNEVKAVIEKSRKKGVSFVVHAAALELIIPLVLGVNIDDLENENKEKES